MCCFGVHKIWVTNHFPCESMLCMINRHSVSPWCSLRHFPCKHPNCVNPMRQLPKSNSCGWKKIIDLHSRNVIGDEAGKRVPLIQLHTMPPFVTALGKGDLFVGACYLLYVSSSYPFQVIYLKRMLHRQPASENEATHFLACWSLTCTQCVLEEYKISVCLFLLVSFRFYIRPKGTVVLFRFRFD